MRPDCSSYGVRQLDTRSFAGTIQQGIVLVDFDEPWCSPCRTQLAILEKLAGRIGAQAVLAELNIDEAQDLAVRFHVQSIPTLLLFKDGHLRGQFVGVQRESRLTAAIQAVAGA